MCNFYISTTRVISSYTEYLITNIIAPIEFMTGLHYYIKLGFFAEDVTLHPMMHQLVFSCRDSSCKAEQCNCNLCSHREYSMRPPSGQG